MHKEYEYKLTHKVKIFKEKVTTTTKNLVSQPFLKHLLHITNLQLGNGPSGIEVSEIVITL